MNRIAPLLCCLVLCGASLSAQTYNELAGIISLSPSPTLYPGDEAKKRIAEDEGCQDKARVYNAPYSERSVDTKRPEREAAVEGRATKTDRDEPDEDNEFPDVLKDYSMIRVGRLAHVHVAVDHDSLNLPVIRTHQYRELHQYGSFGPGVFFQYDLHLDPNTNDRARTRVHLPMDTVEVIADVKGEIDPETGETRSVTTSRTNSIRSLCYYDVPFSRVEPGVTQPRTSSIHLAASAVLTTWSNERFYFEMVDLAGDGSDPRGRLRQIEDAEGRGLVGISYVYDDHNVPADRERAALFMYKRIWGRGGERLQKFTYTDGLVGNAYAITGIKVAGRGWISYAYDDPQKDLTPEEGDLLTVINTNWDASSLPVVEVASTVGAFGLGRIDYPEGDTSRFSTGIDWESRCSTVHLQDVKDINGHADKELFLNLSVWWPDNGVDDHVDGNYAWEEFEAVRYETEDPILVRQADNLIRMVVDVPRERITFFSWYTVNYEGREAICYYREEDPIFGGPRVAQFASVGGYPYYTQYATDWYQVDYEGYGDLRPTAEMGFQYGSKERYPNHGYYVAHAFAGDLGRNGTVVRDDWADDAKTIPGTGLITNTTDDPSLPPVWR